MIVTCPKCGYAWETRSTMEMITCPSCQRKFPRPAQKAPYLLGTLPGAEPCDLCGYEGLEYHICRIYGDAVIVCSTCLRKITNEEVK